MIPDRELIAQAFHLEYEQVAKELGYETREESRRPWDEVPIENRRLMIETVNRVIARPRLIYCWREPMGTMVACDRMAHHIGRHSWETP